MLTFVRRRVRVATHLVGMVCVAVFARIRPHRWLSPRLSLRLLRAFFEPGSAKTAAGMRALVPDDGRRVRTDLVYDPATGRDGRFDLVLPETSEGPPPLIVWVHGGGWYYGRKSDPLPYLEQLSAYGFAGASLNYPRAPEHRHPAAVEAALRAIDHLITHADEYGFDPQRIVLAGDSAGAQVAASAALAWVSPPYAAALGLTTTHPSTALRGTALFCGTFDAAALLDSSRIFTAILATSMWSLAGTRDWSGTETADLMTISRHATPSYPPTFLRAGAADPLTARGQVPLARRLAELGIDLDSEELGDESDPAPHQVQFKLGTPHGTAILDDLVGFLRRVTG